MPRSHAFMSAVRKDAAKQVYPSPVEKIARCLGSRPRSKYCQHLWYLRYWCNRVSFALLIEAAPVHHSA